MRFKSIKLFVVILFFIHFVGFGWFVFSFNNQKPDIYKSSEKIEAAVVLTGGQNRIKAAIDIIEPNANRRLFISGVGEHSNKDNIAKTLGIPLQIFKCCVDLGYQAKNTEGNAKEAKAWLEKQNISSFMLVTSDYHMQRALLAFESYIENIEISTLSIETWDRNLTPLKKFDLVFLYYREYIKFQYFYLKFKLL